MNNVPPAITVSLSEDELTEARRLLQKLTGADQAGEAEAALIHPGGFVRTTGRTDHQMIARAIFLSRRQRARHFGSARFNEPAWDMMLALFINADEDGGISMSRLADYCEAPLSTALRWIEYLEAAKLVVREQSDTDRRKVFLRLTPKGRSSLSSYFDAISKDAPVA